MMLRLIFTGRLVATGPVLPGAGRGEGACDLPVRRDAAGRALIPGTALAGVLRSLATRLAPAIGHRACDALTTPAAHSKPCRCPVCKLFGEIQPDEDNRDGGEASRLLCAHAMAKLPAGATVGFRDGVGIRRGTGASAAASAAKYDYEVLPEDTSFALRIEYQTPAEGEVAEQMQLLAQRRAWRPAGAAGGQPARRAARPMRTHCPHPRHRGERRRRGFRPPLPSLRSPLPPARQRRPVAGRYPTGELLGHCRALD